MNNDKIIIVILAVVTAVLAASLVYYVATYEEPVDTQGFEDKIETLSEQLTQKDLEFEELQDITNTVIELHNETSQKLHILQVEYNQLVKVYDREQISLPKTIVLEQEFTVKVSQNLENAEITIYGTVAKSNYSVSGAIYEGDFEDLKIMHAFKITSDENGLYKLVIDTSDDTKWQSQEYTVSIKSDKEFKQLQFTR